MGVECCAAAHTVAGIEVSSGPVAASSATIKASGNPSGVEGLETGLLTSQRYRPRHCTGSSRGRNHSMLFHSHPDLTAVCNKGRAGSLLVVVPSAASVTVPSQNTTARVSLFFGSRACPGQSHPHAFSQL